MKFYQWRASIDLKVADTWVADGFELTDERLNRILTEAFSNELGYATEAEVKVMGKVTKSPDRHHILEEQGYR